MPPASVSVRSDRRNGRRSIFSEHAAAAALALVLIAAPQLFGGVFPWSAALISLGALLAGVGATYLALRREGTMATDPVFIALLASLGWTALQATPLPIGIVAAIAPLSASQARDAASILGFGTPTVATISRDPGATWEEVLKLAGLVSIFACSYWLASRGNRRQVAWLAALSVCAVAVVTILHKVLDLDMVFGVYQPRFANNPLLSPLMNPNHLAGFLAMGTPLLLGLGLDEERSGVRVALFGAAAVLVTLALLTLSRGGIVAAVGGTVALGVLVKGSRASSSRRRLVPWVLAVLLAGLVIGVYALGDRAPSQSELRDTQKLALIGRAAAFSLNAPWVGVGRGAFSAAFAAFERNASVYRATHPENLVVQWAAEWGWPFALMLLVVIGRQLFASIRETESPLRLGCIAAVLTIASQNLIDFGLELPGISVVAVALLVAAIAPGRAAGRVTPTHRPVNMKNATIVGMGAASLATIAIAPQLPQISTVALRTEIEEAIASGDAAAQHTATVRGVTLHPAEPMFYLFGASHAIASRDPSAPRWLNRVMTLAPSWASPHAEAARWLLTKGNRDQALLELREAADRDPELASRLLCEILKTTPDIALVERARPSGAQGRALEAHVGHCVDPMSQLSQRLDADIRRAGGPASVEATIRDAHRSTAWGNPASSESILQRLVARTPDNAEAQVELAIAILQQQRPRDALDAIDNATPLIGDLRPLLPIKARAQAALGQVEAMRQTVDELVGLSGGIPEQIVPALLLRADLEEQLGNTHQTIRTLREAAEQIPDPAVLERLGTISERAGDHAAAFFAYSTLAKAAPTEARYTDALARLTKNGASVPHSDFGEADMP